MTHPKTSTVVEPSFVSATYSPVSYRPGMFTDEDDRGFTF